MLLLLLSFGCDGRDRVHKSNEEVLIENKQLDSFSENIKYFPEAYSEVETDTILGNGFEVKTKVFTNMSNNVLIETKKDSVINKHLYRERVAELQIIYQGKMIFSKLIDKEYFHNNPSSKYKPLKYTILRDVFIEDKHFSDKTVTLNFLYYYPNDNNHWINMRISFANDGTFKIFPKTIIS